MKRIIICLFCVLTLFGASTQVQAEDAALDDIIASTAEYLTATLPSPSVGSIGGDWTVLGLARSEAELPQGYLDTYIKNVKSYIKACDGILSERKYTEYSRVVLALTAVGADPKNTAGYDLVAPLFDFEKTTKQGLNGSIWALIALDSVGYEEETKTFENTAATIRSRYINHILEHTADDGGWTLSGESADADMTAMALQALARYKDDKRVSEACEKALYCLALLQNKNGGFSSRGVECAESCAQVTVALCALDIPLDDERFTVNGRTVLDAMLDYRTKDGGFSHTSSGATNTMASEQCFYALVALQRYRNAKTSLYDMSDVLALKDKSTKKLTVIYPSKSFSDMTGHKNEQAVRALAERGIVNGKSDSLFDPEGKVTRAELAAMIVRSLGLSSHDSNAFSDVSPSDWFYLSVGTARHYGIINGISPTVFAPNASVTRAHARLMLERAAALCNTSAGLDDIGEPERAATRAELAQMLYTMLTRAGLI